MLQISPELVTPLTRTSYTLLVNQVKFLTFGGNSRSDRPDEVPPTYGTLALMYAFNV